MRMMQPREIESALQRLPKVEQIGSKVCSPTSLTIYLRYHSTFYFAVIMQDGIFPQPVCPINKLIDVGLARAHNRDHRGGRKLQLHAE